MTNSATAALKILQYLETHEILKKTLIEGLSEHVMPLAQIIDENFDAQIKEHMAAMKGWVSHWAQLAHKSHTTPAQPMAFDQCLAPLCLSTRKTILEL